VIVAFASRWIGLVVSSFDFVASRVVRMKDENQDRCSRHCLPNQGFPSKPKESRDGTTDWVIYLMRVYRPHLPFHLDCHRPEDSKT